jgi:hypothetical protein
MGYAPENPLYLTAVASVAGTLGKYQAQLKWN